MEPKLTEKLKWRVGKWLAAPPGEMPPSDPKAAEWFEPEGKPVKNKRWPMGRKSRGAKPAAPKKIDEFYHRGGYSRHEQRDRHRPKAAMTYRRKGAKIERRSNRSRLRRKEG